VSIKKIVISFKLPKSVTIEIVSLCCSLITI